MVRSLFLLNNRPRKPGLGSELTDELVGLLFTTIIPKTIIGISTAGCALLLAVRNGSGSLVYLSVAAIAVTAYRVGCVLRFRQAFPTTHLKPWEQAYGAGNIAFSIVLAAFAVLTLWIADAVAEVMASILIVSFCAGIVARASVRPWIAVSSILISAGTLTAVFASQATAEHLAIAAVLVALIAGSIDTVSNTHRITLEHLTTRRRFAQMAALDNLTGLPNRSMLHERLDAILASEPSRQVAIHFIDLDHFKAINDNYGHAAGDQILVEVSQRILAILPDDAFVSRLGGDEFVVVQPNVTSDHDAQEFGRRIVETLSWPFTLQSGAVAMQASEGCCVVQTGAVTGAEAMAAADAALYEAKRNGRGRSVVRGLRGGDHLDLRPGGGTVTGSGP